MRRNAHRPNGVLQDAAGQTAPTRVCGGHHVARLMAEQHGQAVGRHDGAGCFSCVVPRSIGILRLGDAVGGTNHVGAVRLVQIRHRHGHGLLHQGAVVQHVLRVVAHMQAQVQAGEHAFAHAALPCGD